MASSVFCEPVLAFVKAFRLRGDASALKQAALGRFSPSMLAEAKKSLWEHCRTDLSSLELSFTSRRNTGKRSQASADLDDLVLAFDKLDEVDKLPLIYCEAVDLVKLPPIAADSISMIVSGNADRLIELDERISQLQEAMSDLSSKFVHTAPSDSLPGSFASAVKSSPKAPTVAPIVGDIEVRAKGRTNLRVERADNLVIFGLPEVHSLSVLKSSVDDLFTFLTGEPIVIRDLFRLGRKQNPVSTTPSARPRPVLVKLSTSWDRRIIMSNVRKVKEYSTSGIFIREDLSTEERQKRKEQFLRRKAARVSPPPSVPQQHISESASPSSPSESHLVPSEVTGTD